MNHLYARPGLTTYIIQWQGMDGHWHNLHSHDGTNLELMSVNHAKTVAYWALSESVKWQVKDSHGEVVYSGVVPLHE